MRRVNLAARLAREAAFRSRVNSWSEEARLSCGTVIFLRSLRILIRKVLVSCLFGQSCDRRHARACANSPSYSLLDLSQPPPHLRQVRIQLAQTRSLQQQRLMVLANFMLELGVEVVHSEVELGQRG